MVIIIDGPDFRGKKYLCENLAKIFNLKIKNPNETKDIKNRDYYMGLLAAYNNVVFDTFHMFEVVNNKIRNKLPGICDDDCKEIEQEIIKRNISSIYVTNKHRQLILNNLSNQWSDYELLLASNSYELLHGKHKYSTRVELHPNLWRSI